MHKTNPVSFARHLMDQVASRMTSMQGSGYALTDFYEAIRDEAGARIVVIGEAAKRRQERPPAVAEVVVAAASLETAEEESVKDATTGLVPDEPLEEDEG